MQYATAHQRHPHNSLISSQQRCLSNIYSPIRHTTNRWTALEEVLFVFVLYVCTVTVQKTFDNKRFRSNYSMYVSLVIRRYFHKLAPYSFRSSTVHHISHRCVLSSSLLSRNLRAPSFSYTKIYVYVVFTFPKRVNNTREVLSLRLKMVSYIHWVSITDQVNNNNIN